MALYRFRVSFEDYDDVMREIDIKSNQTFADLHKAIHQSTGYSPEQSSSFYISNDQWTKGEEITYLPNQKRIDRGISLMEKVKLSSFIDDPHQKFYYTYNFDRPYDFHVELMKIILDETPGIVYPNVVRSVGEAPRQFVNTVPPPTEEDDEPATGGEFDFLHEMAYNPDDAEEFSEVSDQETGASSYGSHEEESEEEEDEFGSEFSDDENFEDERGGSHHDDY